MRMKAGKKKPKEFENLNLYKPQTLRKDTIGDMNSSIYRVSPSLVESQLGHNPNMVAVATGFEDYKSPGTAERKSYKIHEVITKQLERP